MTVERARELLKHHAEGKTDEEIQGLIDVMFQIVKISKNTYFAEKLQRDNRIVKRKDFVNN